MGVYTNKSPMVLCCLQPINYGTGLSLKSMRRARDSTNNVTQIWISTFVYHILHNEQEGMKNLFGNRAEV